MLRISESANQRGAPGQFCLAGLSARLGRQSLADYTTKADEGQLRAHWPHMSQRSQAGVERWARLIACARRCVKQRLAKTRSRIRAPTARAAPRPGCRPNRARRAGPGHRMLRQRGVAERAVAP
eukprot:9489669-Pyramimonas_sp.AAC.1